MAAPIDTREQARTAIRDHGGRPTRLRIEILTWLLERQDGATQVEVEQALSGEGDRVTIYRALHWFVEHGLVHRVSTPDRAAVFVAGGAEQHVHFTCEVCGRSRCLGQTTLPMPKLPKGFHSKQVELVVTGRCDRCP
jgi:Fur family ferric uptake transcriptional regulator